MSNQRDVNRRDFVKTTAALGAAGITAPWISANAFNTASQTIRVGLIGCGGRGTGAAVDALRASGDCQLVAMGDVFQDRLNSSHGWLKDHEQVSDRVRVQPEHMYVGFDAYKQVIAAPVDLVILATPPHFRPIHLAHAVQNSKHAFIEKPVAVDPVGVRSVLDSSDKARARGLAIVAGTQRRHERCYLEAMQHIRDGRIGRIVGGSCYWNQGGLWKRDRQSEWTDMEWQLRNWLYFTWLSGDHIVEQHIHNIDVLNWAIGTHPISALGLGGRQVRTDPSYGHIFDHFAIEFEYPGGVSVTSMCRQIDGTDSRVEEVIRGTDGICHTRSGFARIDSHESGAQSWQFRGENPNPFQFEHEDLIASIKAAKPLNEGQAVAESTLSAIMGRMSAYTGKVVTWDQAINSSLDLSPDAYRFGSMPMPEVAVPGRTPLI